MYWSETQIRTCKDSEMNLETGTLWVTLALDMYFSTSVRPPAAHGGRRGLGTVKAWAKSIELLWKETRWKDPERREEEGRKIMSNVRDLGFAGLKGVRRPERPGVHPSDGKGGERNPGLEPKSQGPARKEEGDRTGEAEQPLPLTQRSRACLAERAQMVTNQPRKEHTRCHR